MVRGHSSYNYLVIFTVALGSCTYGFSSAIIGSVFGLPSFFTYFNLSLSGSDSAPTIGAANGLFAGGGMIGCIVAAWLADKIGRVRAIQLICLLGVISGIIQGAAVHIAMFLVGRTFMGMAAAMMNTIIPVYQSEISPANGRGKMVGIHGFMLVIGYALAAWFGYGCYFESNPQIQWRLCLASQIISPGLLLFLSPWVPESPRWLILQDRPEEGLKTLQKLHQSSEDPDGTYAREEYLQIRRQTELDKKNQQSFWEMLKLPHNRKRFFTGIFVQCLCQSTGILVINNYQILLWQGLGMGGSLPSLLYAVYTSWAAVLNWVSSRIIDRFGRVKLLVIGLIGCVLALSCYTAMVATFGGTTNRVGNGFGVFFLYCFITFYAGFVDATSYVYCSEIFPTHMRATGMGASICGLFGMTLLYTEVAATAFASIGWRYYLVFIIVPALGLGVLFKFPETKGLSLEEVAAVFGDEVALDLSHMTKEARDAFDMEIMADGYGDKPIENKDAAEHCSEVEEIAHARNSD
ncbi:general substrate transporter [Bisporella sp. PMI_857]|nr:general substrate transporter [Bisporella sp. PMI_857]